MLQLLIAFSSLPLPALILIVAGIIFLALVLIILVAIVPSAGERLARFLALLKDVPSSKSTINPALTKNPLRETQKES